ncbi:MAG: hypothetical protein LBV09_04615 [Deferribacteraceae bacterium]|jgi:hypothetical protein|nr:hypothetical protein [Deferribacteraceae bacterium]
MKKLLIVLAMVACGASAYAMSFETAAGTIDAYASVRGNLYYQSLTGMEQSATVDKEDRNQVMFGLQNNSRAGMKWAMGDVFAHYEVGFGDTAVNTRLFYAGYKADWGTLSFGRMASIASTDSFYNRKFNEDDGLAGYGTLVTTRREGIMYQNGGFQIALLSAVGDADRLNVAASAGDPAATPPVAPVAGYEYSELIPRIELAYTFPFDFPAKIFGSFAQVQYTTLTDGGDDMDLTAYHVGAVVKPQLTDSIYLTASAFYGVNAGAYGMAKVASYADSRSFVAGNATDDLLPAAAGDDFDDRTAFGGALAVGFKVNEQATVEAGFGYQANSSDVEGQDDKNSMGVYVNCGFKVTPQFTVTPEIAYLDSGDNFNGTTADGTAIQAGVQLRMDI